MQRKPRGVTDYLADFTKILLVIALSPILLPFVGWSVARDRLKAARLVRTFHDTWGNTGKVGVFVYSDSPHWKAHIESAILPRICDKMVPLNWSLRAQWTDPKPVEVQIFEHWAGHHEFNPMAIIVPRRGRVQTIRFWRAFRDFKHGAPAELEKHTAELFARVGAV